MGNKWFDHPKTKCVILCGGGSLRILPLSEERQKSMIPVKNKPILRHIIEYWKKFTNDFVFVVKYKKDDIIEYVKTLSINSEFVEPKELKGIADGLSYTKKLVSEYFIMVLGDCICKGNFTFPENMQQGIGVWETENMDDIRRSYSIEIKDNSVCRVVEKPKQLVNNLCGLGFYFFNKRVFNYIKITKPSKLRNEIEITDVIRNMIDSGEKISPVFFSGSYLNITYPGDLKKAEKIL